MLHDTLVKNILLDLKKRLEAEDTDDAQYATVALDTLQEFIDICRNMTSFNEDIELVRVFNNAAPVGLQEADRAAYILFIHNLFCEGDCYGMVQEDPLGSLVLLGGAFQLVRTISEGDTSDYRLVRVGLDFLLQQALALHRMNEPKLAKRSLLTILEVSSDMDGLQERYSVQDPHEILVDVVVRAAPSAWLLSQIFHAEDDEDAAEENLRLAAQMYEQLVNQLAGKQACRVAAFLGYAEVLAIQDRLVSCRRMLDKAAKLSKKLLKKEPTASMAFMAAVAHHRRGEIYAMAGEWTLGLEDFNKAIKWIVKASNLAPANTHYEDRYIQYLNELGVLHGVRGDFVSSQEIFLKAISYNRVLTTHSEKYKSTLITTLNNMSILMNRFGHFHVAKHYLQESIEVIDGMGDAYTGMDRANMREFLTDTLESLEELMKQRKNAAWRPIWNPDQVSSSSSSRPN